MGILQVKHIYLLFFLLTIVEGPISSFVAAILAGQGVLNFFYVFGIALVGDILGDLFLYALGRSTRKLNKTKLGKRLIKTYKKRIKKDVTPQKKHITHMLEKQPFWYFLIVKITPYLATPGLIYAGRKKVTFFRFLLYSTLFSVLVKSIYLIPGYLGAVSLKQINHITQGRKYIALYIIGCIVLLFLIKKGYTAFRKHIIKTHKE